MQSSNNIVVNKLGWVRRLPDIHGALVDFDYRFNPFSVITPPTHCGNMRGNCGKADSAKIVTQTQ